MAHTSSPALSGTPVLERLERIRVRARRLLLTHGVLVFIAVLLGGVLSLCLLDYLLWFPGAFRLGFLVTLVVVATRLILKRLLPPLTAQFVLLDVATKIEQRFPEFDDRLTSSVSFLTHEHDINDELHQKLVARTEDIAARLPLEDAITTRPLRRVFITALVPLLLAALAVGLRPDLCGLGLRRLVVPLAEIDWPKRVTIEPVSTEVVVANAESVVLSMEVTRGADRTDRAVLYVRRRGAAAERLPMRQEGPTRYAATITAVTEDLTFWFEAGDDSTQRHPGHVSVVARPVVQNLRLELEPPSYVQPAKRRALPLGQTAIDMITGSTLHFAFRSSKPLSTSPAGATVMSSDGSTTLATVDEDDDQKWAAALTPTVDQTYSIALLDRSGFENVPRPSVTVRLTPDAAPVVELLSPTQVLQCTPNATVHLRARVRDDLGLARIGLSTVINDSGTAGWTDITTWTPESRVDRGSATELNYAWSIATMSTAPGDIVRYAMVAEDNRVAADSSAQGRSHLMSLEITSPELLAARIADELHQLATQLRGLGQRQQLLVTRTADLAADLALAEVTDIETTLLDTGTRQRGLAKQLGSVRRKAENLVDRLTDNIITGTQANLQTARFVEQLHEHIEPPARAAAERLHAARADTDDEATLRADVAEALELERAAAAAIAALLEELAVWDDYNSVMVHLRELIDEQQDVSRDTALLQGHTLGQSVDELDDDLRAELQRTAQAQETISTTIDRAVAELRRLRRELIQDRPDEARSLQDAERQLESRQAATLSRDATEAIRQNQTGQAQQHQTALERLLSETIGELERTEARQLAELTKELNRLEDILEALHAQQSALREDTNAASDAGTGLVTLAARQRTLHGSAQQATQALSALPDSEEGTQQVRVAAGHMEQATNALYDEDGPRATAAQETSLTWLARALAWLEQRRDDADKQMEMAQLNATRQALKAARRRQLDLNAATAAVVERVAETGRAARKDTRRARRQAAEQESIRNELVPLLDRLAEAPVYRWVMERILKAMAESQHMLRNSELEAPLTATQHRVIALIDRLIDAIDQVQKMAREQFAAAANGGGGSGSGGGPQAGGAQPVPTIAELLVLKAMQEDLRQQTADVHDRVNGRTADEAQLREIERLGHEQAELKQLTIELTAKARG